MAGLDDVETPKMIFVEGAAPGTPPSGTVYIYAKADGLLYSKDDAGAETPVSSSSGGVTVQDEGTPLATTGTTLNFVGAGVVASGTGATKTLTIAGGGTTIGGLAPYAVIPGTDYDAAAQFSLANRAQMYHIFVPGPMKVRGLRVNVASTGSGSHQWGLFDASANATAATKLAGGSGALGSTNWMSIAATSAPVDVAPGAYVLIFLWPAANAADIYYRNVSRTAGNPTPFSRTFAPTYTWDDTPDLTAGGWADDSSVMSFVLVGDMDGSGNQW